MYAAVEQVLAADSPLRGSFGKLRGRAAEAQRWASSIMRAIKSFSAVVVIAIVVVPSVLIGACYVRAKSYDRAYARVAKGQPKQDVIDAMGQPSEIETCNGPFYAEGRVIGDCSETLVYYSFMERWGVAIDKNGNVIGKYYNVSY